MNFDKLGTAYMDIAFYAVLMAVAVILDTTWIKRMVLRMVTSSVWSYL